MKFFSNSEAAHRLIGVAENGFVDSVRAGLEAYKNKTHWNQSQGSKTAYDALTVILSGVDKKTKTPKDLRNALQQHESTMGKSLKQSLSSVSATSISYDLEVSVAMRLK